MYIKIKNKKVLLICLLVLLVPGFTFAINTIAEGFQVASTVTKIDAYGTCKNVSATDGQTYFIPTNTQAEWQSVIDHKPDGVVLGACTVSCTTKWGYAPTFSANGYNYWGTCAYGRSGSSVCNLYDSTCTNIIGSVNTPYGIMCGSCSAQ